MTSWPPTNQKRRSRGGGVVFPEPRVPCVAARLGEPGSVHRVGVGVGLSAVEENIRAREEYDDAMSSGQQAFLLEESDESPDVFRLSVGSLPPGQSASVSLSYVTELPLQEDGALRFCLPGVLNPRYTPAGGESVTAEAPGVLGGAVPYTLALGAHISSPSSIDRVQSNCPLSPLEYLAEDKSQAKDTLLLLLKSLPLGCYFNIYGFGSTHESFFPESVEYSQDTMDKALAKVKTMQADLGGTEILRPLTEIYHKPCLPAHPRQLFVFTDGEVGNTKQVTDLVKTNSLSHRCFTFGIGEGASSALIRGMATEGSGHFQFITGTERLQPKVMQSLRFALQPAVREISVRWDVPSGLEVSSLSPPLKALFQGQRALLYAQLKGQCDHSAEGSVLLEYKLGDEPYKSKLSFSLKPDKESGLTIHRLGARSLLRSLEREEREQEGEEEKKAVRKRATELSTQSGVVCSHTAFIGVNKENKQPVQGPVLRRNIPRYQLNCPPMVMCFSSTAGMCGTVHFLLTVFTVRACVCRAGAWPRRQTERDWQYGRKSRAKACPSSYGGGLDSGLGLEQQRDGESRRAHYPDCDALQGSDFISPWGWVTKQVSLSGFQDFLKLTGYKGVLRSNRTARSGRSSFNIFHSKSSQRGTPPAPEPQENPLLKLISLQKANGSWDLDEALLAVLGKKKKEVASKMPGKGLDKTAWATLLALLWLHGFKLDSRDEWQFVALKAVSWIKAQPGLDVAQCVQAGATLLGCQVDPQSLGM
nr:PREDICTED: von Willebrand factor A domain-containing protein 5A-like [Lepisosteus oculatus]